MVIYNYKRGDKKKGEIKMYKLMNKIYEFADFLLDAYKYTGNLEDCLESSSFFEIEENGKVYQCKIQFSYKEDK